jgi:hypothetical protein
MSKKRLDPAYPLVKKLPAMNKKKSIPASCGNQARSDNSFTKRSCCREHPRFVLEQRCECFFLFLV